MLRFLCLRFVICCGFSRRHHALGMFRIALERACGDEVEPLLGAFIGRAYRRHWLGWIGWWSFVLPKLHAIALLLIAVIELKQARLVDIGGGRALH